MKTAIKSLCILILLMLILDQPNVANQVFREYDGGATVVDINAVQHYHHDSQGNEEDGFGSFAISSSDLLLNLTVCKSGITLTHIKNKITNFDYLTGPTSLFEFWINDSSIKRRSNKDLTVERVTLSDDKSQIRIVGQAKGLPLAFDLRFISSSQDTTILVDLNLRNVGIDNILVHVIFPRLYGLVKTSPNGEMWASIPQEIGAVVPLTKQSQPIGMLCNNKIGLPNAMNAMEVVSIYDPGGSGGIFFADANGDLDRNIAPIQFTLSADTLSGYWVTMLSPNKTTSLPILAIGLHNSGDWHHAVDYYLKMHKPQWIFPEIPAWFRDQGAIYGFSGGGAGGSYLLYPSLSLNSRITSFEELPRLLDEAMMLGTNIIYLWDYWEGTSEGGRPAYWNKGDYLPRSDLGGASAFRNGIQRVHELGGRVIVYLEPFIIFKYSQIGKEKGQSWGGRDPQGNLYQHYPQNYTMVAPFRPWQDYLIKIAVQLVRDYDVDGIFLDSWAWQMNWPMQNKEEQFLYSSKEYSQGVLTLTDRIRNAIQDIKPDAVVMGETTSGPISRHWHGGLSADFAWLKEQNQGRIVGSPVRYGIPEINFFSNGRNLNELNQIYAAGHNLALTGFNLPMAPYIKYLVGIRQKYKDALIYGDQPYQPATGDPDVAAYFYQGNYNNLITVVNTSVERTYSGQLRLSEGEFNSKWKDLISGEVIETCGGKLGLKIPPKELRILLHVK